MLNKLEEIVFKEFFVTLGYVFILSIVVPYLKYVSKNTKLFQILGIYFNSSKLINTVFFKQINHISVSGLMAHINIVGLKLLYSDILSVEINLIRLSLFEYIQAITKNNKTSNKFKRLWYILKDIKYYDKSNIVIDAMNLMDNYKQNIPSHLMVSIYPYIKVTYEECVIYGRDNNIIDLKEIKKELKQEKARLLISIFEEMMVTYRNQITVNILQQLNSDKNLYELLLDILNLSILTVYINLIDTIDIQLNKLNGRLNGIYYKGFKLSNESK